MRFYKVNLMKKKLILLMLLVFVTVPKTDYSLNQSEKYILTSNNIIEDGWYQATVKYYNYNTGTNSTYTLNVKVEDDEVIEIDFGNGGSVHTGYNNEGYIYSGGDLSFTKDYNDNITEAYTTVTITTSNGNMFNLDVSIE
jgi:hypothetical protein